MINILLLCWTVLAVSLPSNRADFSSGPIAIEVEIRSSIYQYRVTNKDSDPIESVIFHEHAAYNFSAPEGWEIKAEGGFFEAWSDVSSAMIKQHQTGEFSMRVSSIRTGNALI